MIFGKKEKLNFSGCLLGPRAGAEAGSEAGTEDQRPSRPPEKFQFFLLSFMNTINGSNFLAKNIREYHHR